MSDEKSLVATHATGRRGLPPLLLGGCVLVFAGAISPWVLGRLLSPAEAITRPVFVATGAAGFLSLAFGLLCLRGTPRLPGWAEKIVFAGAWFGILLVGSVMLDRLLGRISGAFREGLLFPPSTEVLYDASEFRFTSKINGLGFRDREVSPGRGAGKRVVAVGDSFTYGWGVALEESWVKRVESALRRLDPSVEVLNLGAGGASPDKYVETVRRAMPLLKPDLVVVAVLEGDDMEQMLEEMDRRERPAGAGRGESRWAKAVGFIKARMYPNLTRPRVPRETIKEAWLRQAASITNRLNDVTRDRFSKLGPKVRESLMAGGLNPMWVQMSLAKPDYFQAMSRVDSAEVKRGIRELAGRLDRIRRFAEEGGARVLVLAVPHRSYMTAREQEGMAAAGYSVDPSMLVSGGATDAIRRAAAEARVDFFECDAAFRDAARTNVLYYDMDAHFTPAGNARFAELVEGVLRNKLAKP